MNHIVHFKVKKKFHAPCGWEILPENYLQQAISFAPGLYEWIRLPNNRRIYPIDVWNLSMKCRFKVVGGAKSSTSIYRGTTWIMACWFAFALRFEAVAISLASTIHHIGLRMPNILGMCHPLCSVIKSQGRGNWTVSFFVTFCEFQSEENSWIWCVKKETTYIYPIWHITSFYPKKLRGILKEFIMKKSEISYPFKKHCIIF